MLLSVHTNYEEGNPQDDTNDSDDGTCTTNTNATDTSDTDTSDEDEDNRSNGDEDKVNNVSAMEEFKYLKCWYTNADFIR